MNADDIRKNHDAIQQQLQKVERLTYAHDPAAEREEELLEKMLDQAERDVDRIERTERQQQKRGTPMEIRKKNEAEVIQKCLRAVLRKDYTGTTRADFDDAIEAQRQTLMASGKTPGEAAQAMLHDATTIALYEGREQSPLHGEGGPVHKADEVVSKSADMERHAQEFAARYHVDIAEARKMTADYYNHTKS
jgi:hypothetical protein